MPNMLDAKVTTAEQLLVLDQPGVAHELVRGELRTMSNAGWWHGAVAIRIGARLQEYVERHALGLVFAAETGFLLERSPDTVRAADASFVRADRVPKQPGRGYLEGAPDLAVEVTSPHDSFAAVHEKVLCWLQHGARLVWVVEPKTRSVSVYRPNASIALRTAGDMLLGEDVVPGFAVRIAELFPAMP